MTTTEVVPGVHLVSEAGTNLYVLEEGGSVTLVDAGLPRMWDETERLLHDLGRRWSDVEAIVLTHGHFDHLGLAHRAAAEHRVPVLVHPGDARIVRHPYRYRPGRFRLGYPLRHPRSVRPLSRMVRAGALRVRGVEHTTGFADGQTLAVPGHLTVIATPGHTDGHCVLLAGAHSLVFTGDALVTLDPYTGRTGPRIVGQGGTHDADQARASLAAISGTGARVVAPGHGVPWTDGVDGAVSAALAEPVP